MSNNNRRRSPRYSTQFRLKMKRQKPGSDPAEIDNLPVSKDLSQNGFGVTFEVSCPLTTGEMVDLEIIAIERGIHPIRFEAQAKVAWIRQKECGLQVTEMKPEHRITYEKFLDTLRP